MSAPVSGPIAIGALDLAALLCSRVCHDLISPVGAIVNGLEVMDEDKDEETKTFALDLIKKSARPGLRQAAILPAGLRRGRFGRCADRARRCRKSRARAHRGRQDDDRLELAAGIGGEKPGEAAPQHADGRRRRHPAWRHAHGRSRPGRDSGSRHQGLTPGWPRPPRNSSAAARRRPSTPMPFSPSIPGFWPAIAGLTVSAAAEGEAVVVTAR